jgi:hypothetical protein
VKLYFDKKNHYGTTTSNKRVAFFVGKAIAIMATCSANVFKKSTIGKE